MSLPNLDGKYTSGKRRKKLFSDSPRRRVELPIILIVLGADRPALLAGSRLSRRTHPPAPAGRHPHHNTHSNAHAHADTHVRVYFLRRADRLHLHARGDQPDLRHQRGWYWLYANHRRLPQQLLPHLHARHDRHRLRAKRGRLLRSVPANFFRLENSSD